MALTAGHCVDLDVPWTAAQAEEDSEWDALEETVGKAVEALPKDGKTKPIVIGEDRIVAWLGAGLIVMLLTPRKPAPPASLVDGTNRQVASAPHISGIPSAHFHLVIHSEYLP